MAQKIQVLLIDDLDGSQADGTVRFALDATEYEIDLSAEHARALRDALAATWLRPGRAAGPGGRRKASVRGLNPTEVREWAKAQGIEVKDCGRVPADLVSRFKAATGK